MVSGRNGNTPWKKFLDAISHYYVHRKKEGLPVIDDITWNDLDMDRIFMLLNHTWSCIGESYLYCLLRMPAMEEEDLKGAQPPHRVFPDTPGGTGKDGVPLCQNRKDRKSVHV